MNVLANCTVDSVVLIQPTVVRFKISLERHAHLRNPTIVYNAMQEYAMRYRNNVWGWDFAIEGEWLIIHVSGKINPEVASQFM